MNFSRGTLFLLVVFLISGIDAKKKKLREEVNNIIFSFFI